MISFIPTIAIVSIINFPLKPDKKLDGGRLLNNLPILSILNILRKLEFAPRPKKILIQLGKTATTSIATLKLNM